MFWILECILHLKKYLFQMKKKFHVMYNFASQQQRPPIPAHRKLMRAFIQKPLVHSPTCISIMYYIKIL